MSNLYRSSDDKVFGGVCAGLSHHFDLNVTGVRWATAIVTFFFTGLPLIVYIVFWCILKERPTKDITVA